MKLHKVNWITVTNIEASRENSFSINTHFPGENLNYQSGGIRFHTTTTKGKKYVMYFFVFISICIFNWGQLKQTVFLFVGCYYFKFCYFNVLYFRLTVDIDRWTDGRTDGRTTGLRELDTKTTISAW